MRILEQLASASQTEQERRFLTEYGAVFVTAAVPPPTVIFRDSSEVRTFQLTLTVKSAVIGEYEIELQAPAMEALLDASARAEQQGLRISARAQDAGRRSYEDTVGLWARNVNRGIDHWIELGRLSVDRADQLKRTDPIDQVPNVLEMEDREGLFFGTFFDKSILYSVAAPGTSQHLSLLAFDLKEYEDEVVERVLNESGWYRTVVSDLPHFTYLGHSGLSLPDLGLKQVLRRYGERDYEFWVPDL